MSHIGIWSQDLSRTTTRMGDADKKYKDPLNQRHWPSSVHVPGIQDGGNQTQVCILHLYMYK